jgi:hypothetical protein
LLQPRHRGARPGTSSTRSCPSAISAVVAASFSPVCSAATSAGRVREIASASDAVNGCAADSSVMRSRRRLGTNSAVVSWESVLKAAPAAKSTSQRGERRRHEGGHALGPEVSAGAPLCKLFRMRLMSPLIVLISRQLFRPGAQFSGRFTNELTAGGEPGFPTTL